MKSKTTTRLIGLVGILISVACIALLGRSIDFSKTWEVIRQVNPLMVLAMMAIYLLTFPLRSMRWRIMMKSFNVPHDGVFIQSLFIGFAGNNLLPARGGELLRMEAFSRKTGISRTTSLSSILIEKVMDVIILLSILVGAFIAMRETSEVIKKTMYIMVPATLAVLLVIVVVAIWGARLAAWFSAKPNKLFQTAGRLLANVHSSLNFARSGGSLLRIFLLSALIWSIEVSLYAVGLRAIGVEYALLMVSMTALVLVNFSILVPSSPGYIGVFHAALVLALAIFKIPSESALAAAVLIHASQILPVTVLGLVFGAKYIVSAKNT